MILILGITTFICGILFLKLYLQIRGNKERYYEETIDYPIYHWKFIFKRYTVGYVLAATFILLTLSISIIIVFI